MTGHEALAYLATNRTGSLFSADLEAHRGAVEAEIRGRRILIVGGAGSIGSATLKTVAAFRPRALHVVDTSENNLAELVRDLRSGEPPLAVDDFRTLPLDFGTPLMARFLESQAPYDLVMNFAALKHVRSEKDVCSLLRMLEVNVLGAGRLLGRLAANGGCRRYFCVSTDKAANPVSLMGASKRLMEHVVFSRVTAPAFTGLVTSARFANVAFSDGSLLHGWIRRLEKRQPLAAPRGIRRYFISLPEAGELCLLAAAGIDDGCLMIPRLSPESDLREIVTIAEAFLRLHGYEPRHCEEEAEAKARLDDDMRAGRYPLLVTPADTSGEKPFEEFLGRGEQAVEIGMRQLAAVRYRPCRIDRLPPLLHRLHEWVERPESAVGKEDIVAALASVVEELSHVETGKQLDDRM